MYQWMWFKKQKADIMYVTQSQLAGKQQVIYVVS